jgi:hypothetical protein
VSKLTEIIDAATGDTISIPALLRMMKVLAARTKTSFLGDWVDNELQGYPADAALPDYRGPFHTQVLSSWSGPFQSSITNLPLPSGSVPKELRDIGAFEVSFRESVSELEGLAESKTTLSYAWNADVVAVLNGEIQRGDLAPIVPMHGMVSAYRRVSTAAVQSVLDNVRTRVLDVALELESVLPGAGEPGVVLEDSGPISYIVTNHIYGDGNAVAVGVGAVASVQKGDRESLRRAAAAAGLSGDQIAELDEAIDGDLQDDVEKPGSRVAAFLGRLALGAASGTGQIITGAAGGVIADLVRVYYSG